MKPDFLRPLCRCARSARNLYLRCVGSQGVGTLLVFSETVRYPSQFLRFLQDTFRDFDLGIAFIHRGMRTRSARNASACGAIPGAFFQNGAGIQFFI